MLSRSGLRVMAPTRVQLRVCLLQRRGLAFSYRNGAPKLADWLEANVPESLVVFCLPEPHQRRMRTANPIERALQQEIKRRTVKVRVFPNEAALLRLVTAILVETDEGWSTSDRLYINFHHRNA